MLECDKRISVCHILKKQSIPYYLTVNDYSIIFIYLTVIFINDLFITLSKNNRIWINEIPELNGNIFTLAWLPQKISSLKKFYLIHRHYL